MSFDITLITCSYDTPKVTLTMLKSWKHINSNITNNLLLIDNSTNEDTAELLHESKIPFYRNPDGRHYEGVQIALDKCNTKYALLVDTDVIFKENLSAIVNTFIDSGCAIMGEECGDRGGSKLYTRIHPWFCFIDVEQVKNKNIKFINMDKIIKTNSGRFYSAIPTSSVVNGKKYDVGATFYEDIIENGLKAFNIKLDPKYYFHYEGLSWQGKSGNAQLIEINRRNLIYYSKEEMKLQHEALSDWYTI